MRTRGSGDGRTGRGADLRVHLVHDSERLPVALDDALEHRDAARLEEQASSSEARPREATCSGCMQGHSQTCVGARACAAPTCASSSDARREAANWISRSFFKASFCFGVSSGSFFSSSFPSFCSCYAIALLFTTVGIFFLKTTVLLRYLAFCSMNSWALRRIRSVLRI